MPCRGMFSDAVLLFCKNLAEACGDRAFWQVLHRLCDAHLDDVTDDHAFGVVDIISAIVAAIAILLVMLGFIFSKIGSSVRLDHDS